MVQICTFLSSTNFEYLFIPTGQLEILFCAYIWPILFWVPCLCLVDLWEFVYVVAINIILNMHCKYLIPAVAYLFFSLNHVFDEWAFLILMNLNLSIFFIWLLLCLFFSQVYEDILQCFLPETMLVYTWILCLCLIFISYILWSKGNWMGEYTSF